MNSKISQQIRNVRLRAYHRVQRTQPILIDRVIHYGRPQLNHEVSLWFLFGVEHTKHPNGIMHVFSQSSDGIISK